jgi:hypothetical protein
LQQVKKSQYKHLFIVNLQVRVWHLVCPLWHTVNCCRLFQLMYVSKQILHDTWNYSWLPRFTKYCESFSCIHSHETRVNITDLIAVISDPMGIKFKHTHYEKVESSQLFFSDSIKFTWCCMLHLININGFKYNSPIHSFIFPVENWKCEWNTITSVLHMKHLKAVKSTSTVCKTSASVWKIQAISWSD